MFEICVSMRLSSQVKSSQAKPSESSSELHSNRTLSHELRKAWDSWKKHLSENFKPLTPTSEDAILMELDRRYPDESEKIEVVQFSIMRQAKNLILTGDHKQERAPPLMDRARRVNGSRKEMSFEDFGL